MKPFKVEKFHADIISKPTLFKVLKILDNEIITTPVLFMDGDKIREKISVIGRHITNAKVFYALKANPDIAVAEVVKDMGLGFEIASEGELEI
ncbi:MAG: hypothetical protein JRJ85_20195, partial [Deltaproteobacteria bacterium]|nr:hypothetical protein [Deltaproteobacteria bacterium]